MWFGLRVPGVADQRTNVGQNNGVITSVVFEKNIVVVVVVLNGPYMLLIGLIRATILTTQLTDADITLGKN